MTADPKEVKSPQPENDDVPLDPALAARLKIAEAEVRSHMDSGIWTTRRIAGLITVTIVAILILIGIMYLAKAMLGKHV